MSSINTLTEFLTQADTQFQLFDLGRQVRPLPSDLFVRIEQQQEPYPWPLQQHAWLGVHFFQPTESRHYLWFLKFALDERGLLISSGPKHFMDQVVETLGYKLTGELDEEKAQRLADNPYTFRPAEAKMASVHAKLARQLEQAPSAYYEALCHYLAAPGEEGWQALGLQGFADLAERLQVERNLALVCKALPMLPQAPSTPCARAWRTPPCLLPCKVHCWSASARSRSAPSLTPKPWPICAGHWPPARATDCAPTSC